MIRLAAALQVVIVHGNEHLHLNGFQSGVGKLVLQILLWFPGVPIFFVISGFLISKSYERQRSIGEYAYNRFLRIYPALWFCLLLSIVLVALTAPAVLRSASTVSFFSWVFAQASIFQFFNPQFLRSYGVGVINGSLWTIPVELQFYIALPLLYFFTDKSNCSTSFPSNLKLVAIILIFLIANQTVVALQTLSDEELWFKLIKASMLPYFWLFALGVLVQRNWNNLEGLFRDRLHIWMGIYVASNLILGQLGFRLGTNNPFPPLAILLAGLTLSLAFSYPTWSDRLLRKNDISYGVYIYHMLVINVFVEFGLTEYMTSGIWALAITISMAILSWKFIESPCLRNRANPRRLIPETQ